MSARAVSAWLVHLYTATSAVLAFLATTAVMSDRYRDAFLYLAAALLVDATDGMLARRVQVRDRLPSFDGARLDDIVDYLTFVFVPALLLYRSGALPVGVALPVVCAVLLSSAYGFSRADAKTADHFFMGFPSYWNIVALYLYAAGTAPPFNAMLLTGLSVLVFVPIGFVYPTRTLALRPLTLAMSVVWGMILMMAIVRLPELSRTLLAWSLVYPAYYTVLSLVLHRRR